MIENGTDTVSNMAEYVRLMIVRVEAKSEDDADLAMEDMLQRAQQPRLWPRQYGRVLALESFRRLLTDEQVKALSV